MAAPTAPGPTTQRPRARPSPQTVAHVLARDETCVFPGCRVPAFRCDLDHVVRPRPGGGDEEWARAQEADNLVSLCRHHRVVRSRDGWRPSLLADGAVRWTAPSGYHYVREGACRTG